jgi:phosphatidate phosphatase LPIN
MNLKSGGNQMSFSVNRATCGATLWYWKHDVPIVISDIDGTITKSDVLGHVLTSIGRDWTHQGVAKLYTEISANGYNFLYLTSRSVGQADRTRGYIDGVVQDGYKLPKGPIILSPDQTIAALRREVYLRKPEVFKMACLRDIMNLFAGHGGTNDTTASAAQGLSLPAGMAPGSGKGGSPFYAGFGNRLTDALSYRSVNIPSTRIFTINSNSEVSLDLLSLNTYKTGYASMREIVDHYFPPIGLRLLVEGGAEDFTDFNYWRDKPLDVVDFTDSESESGDADDDMATGMNSLELDRTQTNRTGESIMSGSAILSEDEAGSEMLDSYLSEGRGRPSMDDSIYESIEEGDEDDMTASMLEDEEYEGDEEEKDVSGRVTPPRDTSAERLMGGNTPRRPARA